MLKLNKITKYFEINTVNEKLVIDNLSLDINDRDFISIVGANGSGKSTLLNLIAGTIFCDSGQILLNDDDITLIPEHKRAKYIGRLFQDPMLSTSPGLTIEDNLFLSSGRGSWLSSIKKEDKQLFIEKLKMLNIGLENNLKQNVGSLSGGQRQALALLMATINPPQILLLDEHTAALDPGSQERVMQLTKDIVESNKITCLMVTHDMKQALKTGNRLIMMNEGNIVLDIAGEEKYNMSVDDLVKRFNQNVSKDLSSDRLLLG